MRQQRRNPLRTEFLPLSRRLGYLLALSLPVLAASVDIVRAQAVKFAPRGDFDLLIRQSATQPGGAQKRRTIPGIPDVTYRLERYHQGWMRMDGLLDENGQKLPGPLAEKTGYFLSNTDKKLAFSIRSDNGRQVIDKLPTDGGDMTSQFQVKPTGETLTIAGESCKVMTVEIADTTAKTCVTADGLTLRMEMQQGPNLIVHEAVKLNWRAQNAADFVPPASVK